eukprot:Rmarinus@m.23382
MSHSTLSADLLRQQGQRKAPIIHADKKLKFQLHESDVIKPLQRGGIVVLTSKGAIQFGIPPETIKDTMKTSYKVPTTFVVPEEPFHKKLRMNVAEFEFPAYFNFFCLSRPIVLLCSKEVEMRIRTVFEQTLMGPSDNKEREEFSALLPDDAVPNLRKEGDYIRSISWVEGKPISIDALIVFHNFDEHGRVAVDEEGTVVVQQHLEDEYYTVIDQGKEIAKLPLEIWLPPHLQYMDSDIQDFESRFEPPVFGVTMLGNSHGFDPNGSTTGFVAWVNQKGIMVDPPPFSGDVLAHYGIPARLIGALILTHCHADHDAGTFQKILQEGKVKLITTPTIFNSFLRKYSAISGLDARFLARFVDFTPVTVGEHLDIYGGELDFHYSLHTIPCIGFSVKFGGKSFVYSGDTCTDPKLVEEMHEKNVIGRGRRERLLHFPWHHTVVLHECGVPPIHTPMRILEALPLAIKQRLYLVHTSSNTVKKGSGLKIAKEGVANTIIIDAEAPACADAIRTLQLISQVDFSDLNFSHAHEILHLVNRTQYMAGSTIVEYGTKGDRMYIISSGVVHVDAKVLTKFYYPGDYFGETSLITNKPRNATITAFTDVDLIEIHKQPFFQLVNGTDIVNRMLHLATMRTEKSWQTISDNSILCRLSSAQKTKLQEIMERRQVSPGEVVWESGKQVCEAVLIDAGEFHYSGLVGRNAVRADFLADVAGLYAKLTHVTTLKAATAGSIFTIARREFLNFLEHNPGVELVLMHDHFAPFKEDPKNMTPRSQPKFRKSLLDRSAVGEDETKEWGVAEIVGMEIHPTEHNKSDLESIGIRMFELLGLVDALKMPMPKLRRFFHAVSTKYQYVPYHNFNHATQVLQQTFHSIVECQKEYEFTRIELLVLATAALCHDVDHQGIANSRIVHNHDYLALLYNDISPLEMHHTSTTFRLLTRPDMNFLETLPEEDYLKFRNWTVKLILATDMAHHNAHQKELAAVVENFDPTNQEHRLTVLIAMLKCADIGVVAAGWDMFDVWVRVLQEEESQWNEEARDVGSFAIKQLKFLRMVKPFYESIGSIFSFFKESKLAQLISNTEKWEKEKLKSG